MTTLGELVLARADDDSPAVRFEDVELTYREWVRGCEQRAVWWASTADPERPPHVGLLLDNTPEFTLWLGAAGLSGATVVGLNSTRRGDELAGDIARSDCQLVITDEHSAPLLDGIDLPIPVLTTPVLSWDSAPIVADLHDRTEGVSPATRFALVFTSGTSGSPKAVICSQGRVAGIGAAVARMMALGPDDVAYLPMPLFHSNALFAGWASALSAGACVALRRRFSASGFLPDVRRHGATFFTYVGNPLAYVLATPEQLDDADNPLARGFGNEANAADRTRFEDRFGCRLTDGYGQSETGATIAWTPEAPPGALGRAAPAVKVLDPDTGVERPPARFDEVGRVVNLEEATGEIVNTEPVSFEGYYGDPEATAARLRHGWYWTGDLAYRDAQGWFFFAGRSADWMRIDGENIGTAPIERIVSTHPGVVLCAAFGVPDPSAGDRMMVALQLAGGVASFDPDAFAGFLQERDDVGRHWYPTFVTVVEEMPVTATSKVRKRDLASRRWDVDPVWMAEGGRGDAPLRYRRLTADDRSELARRFEAAGRAHLLAISVVSAG